MLRMAPPGQKSLLEGAEAVVFMTVETVAPATPDD
jgi:hypothetical protein